MNNSLLKLNIFAVSAISVMMTNVAAVDFFDFNAATEHMTAYVRAAGPTIQLNEDAHVRDPLGSRIESFLGEGANANAMIDGRSMLDIAMDNECTHLMTLLINYGADIARADGGIINDIAKTVDSKYKTVFDHAVQARYMNAAIRLQGVRGMFHDTVLIVAAEQGREDVVQALLDHNVNVDRRNAFGENALMNAARNGHLDVVKQLKDSVTNINARDMRGENALMEAEYNGNIELVRTLLQRRDIDVNAQNTAGWTVLMMAVNDNRMDIVAELLNHRDINDHEDINVNIVNVLGRTALMYAVEGGHIDIVRALLDHKDIDVNVKNKKNETALDIAKKKEYSAIADLLKQHGAQ